MPIAKVLLVDDHNLVRSGVRMLLEDADFEVVGEASDGRAGIEMLRESDPDVVVMDIRMPNLNGLEATRQALTIKPTVKVICISANTDDRSAAEAIRAGAMAFVSKVAAYEDLINAIKSVLQGKIYLSDGITVPSHRSSGQSQFSSIFETLSPREREVLQLLAEGRATKEIAHDLSCSVKTAETHRRNLMLKLNLDSVAELTKYAIREGITSV